MRASLAETPFPHITPILCTNLVCTPESNPIAYFVYKPLHNTAKTGVFREVWSRKPVLRPFSLYKRDLYMIIVPLPAPSFRLARQRFAVCKQFAPSFSQREPMVPLRNHFEPLLRPLRDSSPATVTFRAVFATGQVPEGRRHGRAIPSTARAASSTRHDLLHAAQRAGTDYCY